MKLRVLYFKIILLMAFSAIGFAPLSAQSLEIYTHNTKSQVINKDGLMRGLPRAGLRAVYLEIVREILSDLEKSDYPIIDVPFARGFYLIENQQNTLLFNVARTKNRENKFKWIGPIWNVREFIYASATNLNAPYTLDAALKRKICVVRGNLHDTFFTNLKASDLVRVNDYTTCFKLLVSGRVDLTASASVDLFTRLDAVNISYTDVVNTGIKISEHGGYIATSNDVDPKLITDWQNVLDKMKEDGRYDMIVRKFAHPFMNVPQPLKTLN